MSEWGRNLTDDDRKRMYPCKDPFCCPPNGKRTKELERRKGQRRKGRDRRKPG